MMMVEGAVPERALFLTERERIRGEGKDDDWSERVIHPHGIGIHNRQRKKKQRTR